MNNYLSELDLNRFGVVIVKADCFESTQDVDECLSFSKNNNAELLIARLDASRLDLAQKIEAAGAILCDTLIYYELRCLHVKPSASLPDDTFMFRDFRPEDHTDVVAIARAAFAGYYGHYHSDSMLTKDDCDETYVSWCETTIENIGKLNKVLVAEDTEGVCGFLTMRAHEGERLELVLSGVAKRVEGRGVYRRLIREGIKYAVNENFKCIFSSTQIVNLAVQRVWIAHGFFPIKFVHTFHKWFNFQSLQLVKTAV